MQHLYLSPHFDDAALSCGGQIARRAATGETVVVANIFGGRPDYTDLSPFARAIHGRPHAGEDPIAERWEEEQRALAILGAAEQRGGYLDCIYRQDPASGRWLYAGEAALFGPVDPAEEPLVAELADRIAAWAGRPGETVVYAPLAVGNHVDHQLVHAAARRLPGRGYTVRFYEDYPYVVRDGQALESTLARQAGCGGWRALPEPFDAASLQRKIEAVRAYRSQLGVLFPGDVAAALASFAEQVAATADCGLFAERLWVGGA